MTKRLRPSFHLRRQMGISNPRRASCSIRIGQPVKEPGKEFQLRADLRPKCGKTEDEMCHAFRIQVGGVNVPNTMGVGPLPGCAQVPQVRVRFVGTTLGSERSHSNSLFDLGAKPSRCRLNRDEVYLNASAQPIKGAPGAPEGIRWDPLDCQIDVRVRAEPGAVSQRPEGDHTRCAEPLSQDARSLPCRCPGHLPIPISFGVMVSLAGTGGAPISVHQFRGDGFWQLLFSQLNMASAVKSLFEYSSASMAGQTDRGKSERRLRSDL